MATARCSISRSSSTAAAWATATSIPPICCRRCSSAARAGTVKGGRHIVAGALTPNADLLISMAETFGIELETVRRQQGPDFSLARWTHLMRLSHAGWIAALVVVCGRRARAPRTGDVRLIEAVKSGNAAAVQTLLATASAGQRRRGRWLDGAALGGAARSRRSRAGAHSRRRAGQHRRTATPSRR